MEEDTRRAARVLARADATAIRDAFAGFELTERVRIAREVMGLAPPEPRNAAEHLLGAVVVAASHGEPESTQPGDTSAEPDNHEGVIRLVFYGGRIPGQYVLHAEEHSVVMDHQPLGTEPRWLNPRPGALAIFPGPEDHISDEVMDRIMDSMTNMGRGPLVIHAPPETRMEFVPTYHWMSGRSVIPECEEPAALGYMVTDPERVTCLSCLYTIPARDLLVVGAGMFRVPLPCGHHTTISDTMCDERGVISRGNCPQEGCTWRGTLRLRPQDLTHYRMIRGDRG